MKVLISGGRKTINIIKSISSRFVSGSVELLMENNIDDIESLLSRGEYFDRAIIIEQSWTLDGEEQDEIVMRQSINNFATIFSQRCSKDATCIIVATTERMAKLAAEETIGISDSSCVILKAPPYDTSFFIKMVTIELSNIPENMKFTLIDDTGMPLDDMEDTLESESVQGTKDIVVDIKESEYAEETIINMDDEFFGNDSIGIEEAAKEEYGDGENNIESNFEEPLYADEIEVDDVEEIEGTEDAYENFENMPEILGNTMEDGEEKQENIKESIEENEIIQYNEEIEVFNEEIYKEDNSNKPELKLPTIKNKKATRQKINISPMNNQVDSLRLMLNTFKSRGNSIVITGASGSGKSTLAYNLANTIMRLGYTVLLVDMDTKGRAQAYISKDAFESVHSHDAQNASLKMAISNPTNGVGRYVNIVSPGFHILTMGLAGDIVDSSNLADKQKLLHFSNIVRNNYNCIIYDIPFETAVEHCSDITYSADNIVLTIDSSNWGIMKALIELSNIDNDDIEAVIFSRAQVCFTKYAGLNKVLGTKVKSVKDVLHRMDTMIKELIGIEPEFLFSKMQICDIIQYDDRYENCWFEKAQMSDYRDGNDVYVQLLKNILIKE